MNSKFYEQVESAGAYETAGTSSNAGSPYYVILTIPGSESGTAEGIQPAYVNYAENAGDQLICVATDEQQILYSGYTLGEAGAMHTTAPGQQYSGNATAVTDSQAGGSNAGHPQPTYVKYADSAGDQLICVATDEQQMLYSGYTLGETGAMHTTAPGQHYSGNTTAVTDNQAGGSTAGPMVAQGNSAYHIKQGFNRDAAHILTATQILSLQAERANARGECSKMVPRNKITNISSLDANEKPDLSLDKYNSLAAILWLRDNFEVSEGASIPCSKAYNHYLHYCSENKITSVNEAAFGKCIRLVFVGLTTRRFGTRGNNRYHYCGIQLKSGPLLNQPLEDSQKLCKLSFSNGSGSGAQKIENQQEQNTNYSSSSNHFSSTPHYLHHRYKPGDESLQMPKIPGVVFPLGATLPEDYTVEDVMKFHSLYSQHCEAFLYAAVNLEFQTVERLLREFWRGQSSSDSGCEKENDLPQKKMYLLCTFGPVQQFVRRVDYLFYQKIVDTFIPDVLMPIPSSLAQAIRSFAKELKSWMTAVMKDYPEELAHIKVSAVTIFAQTLLRYISINQLAQGARPVLQNSSQTDQMLSDLIRIDFSSVQDRVSWACQSEDSVLQLEADFKKMLHNQNSLEQWAAWLKGVITEVLKPHEGTPNFAKAAKEFLLNWSFYNSMVVRDLTLRKAPSFGSLYVIRALCEEYMFFLIVHQVAMATGEVPLVIMGERNSNNPFNGTSSSQGPTIGVSPLQWDLMTLLENDDFQSINFVNE
jgi:regulatory factor X 1/2/3